MIDPRAVATQGLFVRPTAPPPPPAQSGWLGLAPQRSRRKPEEKAGFDPSTQEKTGLAAENRSVQPGFAKPAPKVDQLPWLTVNIDAVILGAIQAGRDMQIARDKNRHIATEMVDSAMEFDKNSDDEACLFLLMGLEC